MTLYMRADIRERWIEELLSGKYVQGSGELHSMGGVRQDGDDDTERFCCLGVLCVMAAMAGAVESEPSQASYVMTYGSEGHTDFLPPEVIQWAGMRFAGRRAYLEDDRFEESRGILGNGNPDEGSADIASLSQMNDNGVPFEKIADAIERWVVAV